MSDLFYSFGPILSHNCEYNFIAGGRGIGKTYGAKEHVINQFLKKKKQFIYVRRFKEELQVSASSFFADIAHAYPDYVFRTHGREAQVCKASEDEDKRKWRTMGYFIALSVSATLKSVAYPNVTTIVYDEFIPEKGRRELKDEFNAFNNFYNTVNRYRDVLKGEPNVRVLFLANSVTIMNAYFLALEIRPDECGEWHKSHDGFVIAHFPDEEAFKTLVMSSRFGRFTSGTEYEQYSTHNKFSDAHTSMIASKKPRAKYVFSVDTDKSKFSVWLDMITGEYYLQSKCPKNEVIFVLDPSRMREGRLLMLKSDQRLKILKSAFKRGTMLFDKPVTRNAFLEIMK